MIVLDHPASRRCHCAADLRTGPFCPRAKSSVELALRRNEALLASRKLASGGRRLRPNGPMGAGELRD